jgi:L-lactate dehydrogenase complex protein LldG
MSSRSEILSRIRRQPLESAPLPALEGPWIAFADRESQFTQVVNGVGGTVRVRDPDQSLAELLLSLPCMENAAQIVCTLPAVRLGNASLDDFPTPQSLAAVDVAILPGEFAVAENGAVWVTDRGLRHRAIYFITQHLVLVVPRQQMIDHMHQAYERLPFDKPGYGLFISGPSKTADIEQSLVIGAHGPRSLTVVLDSGE